MFIDKGAWSSFWLAHVGALEEVGGVALVGEAYMVALCVEGDDVHAAGVGVNEVIKVFNGFAASIPDG